jgi:hypothetical protein
MAKGQVTIATHTFSGSVTSSTSTRNTSGTLASNVNYTGLILGSLTAATATGAYQATGWTTGGTRNDNHYFEFSISPASTYQLNFTSLSIILTRGNNGPQNIQLRYSTDGGSTFTNVGTYNHTSNNFTVNPSSGLPANHILVPKGYKAYLFDGQDSTELNPTERYWFNLENPQNDDRFSLHFVPLADQGPTALQPDAKGFQIHSHQDKIYLRFEEQTRAQVEVIDVQGRAVRSYQTQEQNLVLKTGLSGMYLVKVSHSKGSYSTKLWFD